MRIWGKQIWYFHIYALCLYTIQLNLVVKLLCNNRNFTDSFPGGDIGIFLSYKILPIALWPGGRLCF